MTHAEIVQLNANLALLGRTRQSIPFVYTAAGADGAPLVHTDPERIAPNITLHLARNAVDKRILRGRAYRQSDGLIVFELPHDVVPAQAERFVRDLTSGLAGQVADLTRAVVQVATESPGA